MSFDEESTCKPINTLRELDAWTPSIATRPLQQVPRTCLMFESAGKKLRRSPYLKSPKTLVCHDMKGGYLDDRLVNGSWNPNAFMLTQWSVIDIFVYFSHHFITIPPPCWIEAARLHGVPVLGTFITEWNDGAVLCRELLSSKERVDKAVTKLAGITRQNNFDGWLINIENPIELEHIDNLVYFLCRLKSQLSESLTRPPLIIWYDSVTVEGKLKWQNELNETNKLFFDACDGIFLNYNWKEENLLRSFQMSEERALDVFVGVDVFGRGCFGGGGFNCNLALAEIRKHGLSAAIFAPGWIYEHYGPRSFSLYSLHYWLKLTEWLNIRCLSSLPIRTSFCAGFGLARFRHGERVRNGPWWNLGLQNLQPWLVNAVEAGSSSNHVRRLGGDWERAVVDHFSLSSKYEIGRISRCISDAYLGGSCLRLQGEGDCVFPLFFCDIHLHKGLLVIVAFKREPPDCRVHLVLQDEKKTLSLSLDDLEVCRDDSCNVQVVGKDDFDKYRSVIGPDVSLSSSDWLHRAFVIGSCAVAGFELLRSVFLTSSGVADVKLGFLGLYSV